MWCALRCCIECVVSCYDVTRVASEGSAMLECPPLAHTHHTHAVTYTHTLHGDYAHPPPATCDGLSLSTQSVYGVGGRSPPSASKVWECIRSTPIQIILHPSLVLVGIRFPPRAHTQTHTPTFPTNIESSPCVSKNNPSPNANGRIGTPPRFSQ